MNIEAVYLDFALDNNQIFFLLAKASVDKAWLFHALGIRLNIVRRVRAEKLKSTWKG